MEKMKIAVLIDGDNANQKVIGDSLARVAEFGNIVLKRVYGDWSRSNLQGWRDIVNRHSIKAIQTFAYVKGKNSTDIALCIDAMDLLYSLDVDCYCIISSDCDFTGLVQRLKESGKYTIGIGKECSCNSFMTACDTFMYEQKPKKEMVTEPVGELPKVVDFLAVSIPRISAPKVLRKIEL